ncbi:hypothetical protein RJT34_07596 [Clitoria ternatea]|uniref:Secreted protein n=1 Tax=Clitoria ternatea TaxID=43366 RepID=A0AAN9PUY0_CLITE
MIAFLFIVAFLYCPCCCVCNKSIINKEAHSISVHKLIHVSLQRLSQFRLAPRQRNCMETRNMVGAS